MCCNHIHSIHYVEYQKQCTEKNIPKNIHTIPQMKLSDQAKAKSCEKGGMQQMALDGILQKTQGPHVFSREEVLKDMAQFVVCNNQVHSG